MGDSTKRRSPWRRIPAVVVPSLLFFSFRVSSRAPHGSGLRGNSGRQGAFIAPPSLEQHLEVDRSLLAEPKPIIYTFDASLEKQEENDKSDKELIAAWNQAWTENGWQPVVLTIDHARQYPQYEQVNSILDGLSFGESDRVRFWRWLAMAVAGGGWLVDYHTFPLNKFTPELPNRGKLTIHEPSQTGDIPSMVSGSGDEWFRLARTLLENFRSNKKVRGNDVKTLADLQDEEGGSLIELMTNVISEEDLEACEKSSDKYAVHFSSISSLLDSFESDYSDSGKDVRAKMVSEWISKWRAKCSQETETS